jgi:hypothetical protein
MRWLMRVVCLNWVASCYAAAAALAANGQ